MWEPENRREVSGRGPGTVIWRQIRDVEANIWAGPQHLDKGEITMQRWRVQPVSEDRAGAGVLTRASKDHVISDSENFEYRIQ